MWKSALAGYTPPPPSPSRRSLSNEATDGPTDTHRNLVGWIGIYRGMIVAAALMAKPSSSFPFSCLSLCCSIGKVSLSLEWGRGLRRTMQKRRDAFKRNLDPLETGNLFSLFSPLAASSSSSGKEREGDGRARWGQKSPRSRMSLSIRSLILLLYRDYSPCARGSVRRDIKTAFVSPRHAPSPVCPLYRKEREREKGKRAAVRRSKQGQK